MVWRPNFLSHLITQKRSKLHDQDMLGTQTSGDAVLNIKGGDFCRVLLIVLDLLCTVVGGPSSFPVSKSTSHSTKIPLLGAMVLVGVTVEATWRVDLLPAAVLGARIVWGGVHKHRGEHAAAVDGESAKRLEGVRGEGGVV
jgi:hypothetical protein